MSTLRLRRTIKITMSRKRERVLPEKFQPHHLTSTHPNPRWRYQNSRALTTRRAQQPRRCKLSRRITERMRSSPRASMQRMSTALNSTPLPMPDQRSTSRSSRSKKSTVWSTKSTTSQRAAPSSPATKSELSAVSASQARPRPSWESRASPSAKSASKDQ